MNIKSFLFLGMFLNAVVCTHAQDSLALTPPMGWNSWNLFEDEVSESLVKQIADGLVSSGMKEAGYRYIVMDDFWVGGRNARNELYPDAVRFPHGMKALADYVHAKGLKLGIYSDAAQLTCGGVAGSYNFEEQDARTFADWGIDYLKYDYCNAPDDMAIAMARYKKMGDALKSTHRPIIYSICEWGAHQPALWARAAGGHLWRTGWDIRDAWQAGQYSNGSNGIMNTLDQQEGLEKYAGPGGWNDPDLLVVGLFGKGKSSSAQGKFKGCTLTEYRSHFALWCMLAAPLMVNLDVRAMPDSVKSVLLNKELIAIDQDAEGRQGSTIYKKDGIQVLQKPLSGKRYALCILNRNDVSTAYTFPFSQLGLRGKWATHYVLPEQKDNTQQQVKGLLASHECHVFVISAVD